MTSNDAPDRQDDPPPVRSLAVRRAAARVYVKAARKQGKTPIPRLVELAESEGNFED